MTDKLIVPDAYRGKVARMVERVFHSIHDGTITQEEFLMLLRLAREGTVLIPDPTREFDDLLSGLGDQRSLFLELAKDLWPEPCLDALRRLHVPDHEQSLRNCAVLYLPSSTFSATIKAWEMMLWRSRFSHDTRPRLEQRFVHDADAWPSEKSAVYEPGEWYYVYLDLLAEWKPYQSLSTLEPEPEPGEGSEAGPEVMAALALNMAIPPAMDGGRRLPHMFMPGIRLPGTGAIALQSARIVRAFEGSRSWMGTSPDRLDIQEVSARKGYRGTSAPRVLKVVKA